MEKYRSSYRPRLYTPNYIISILQSPHSDSLHRWCLILASPTPVAAAAADVPLRHGKIALGSIFHRACNFSHVFLCFVRGRTVPAYQKQVCVTLINVCLFFLYRSTRTFCTVKYRETGLCLSCLFIEARIKKNNNNYSVFNFIRIPLSHTFSPCFNKYNIYSQVIEYW